MAEKIPEKIPNSEINKRVDLRGTPTVTIDPDDAKDYDDALSVKRLKWQSGKLVYTSDDVSYYAKEKTVL